nr:hypothetical protein Hi04_10k_c1511_00033 [uncultured bacterium]
MELQSRRADAGFFAAEPTVGREAIVRFSRRVRTRQGAAQVPGGGRGLQRRHLPVVPGCNCAGPHGAPRGDQPRRRPARLVVRVAVLLAGRHCDDRCAAATLSVQPLVEDDAPGVEGRGKGIRRPPGNEAANPPVAADARPAPHDAQGAFGGRGDREPDALRGGVEVRSEEHARTPRARQGRRPGRREHTPHRRGAPRTGVRISQARAGVVQIDGS